MKKALHIIFSFYLLALALVPCGDKDMHGSAASIAEVLPAGGPDDHGDRDCTPLCVCVCCSSIFVVEAKSSDPVVQIAETKEFPVVIAKHTHPILVPVWQPPRLS